MSIDHITERHLPRPDPRGPHQMVIEAWRNERANHYLLDCGRDQLAKWYGAK